MRISMTTIFFIIIITLITKSITSQLLRTSIFVRSRCFDDDKKMLVIGGKNVVTPYKKGLYAVSITRTFSGVHNRILHVGVLKINMFEDQFNNMDAFFQKSIEEGATHLILFSIGTTHEKGVLEIIRVGILSGEYEKIAVILKKYSMRKFISQSHGIRSPYVMIKDIKSKNAIQERTGPIGGTLVATI